MKIKTILIIDDSEADQLLNQIVLESFNKNISILKAYDGKEALEILETSNIQPEVILLDINMPGTDGHEFLALYSQQEKNCHVVVMLTSSSQTADKERCMAYPFVKKYIDKPLTIEKITEIESIIE